ncbi:MAG: prephenate dehydratase domain-containing protein [Gemmatimonadales bacterium]
MTRIAFQGAPGAFSWLAARDLFPRAKRQAMSDFAAVVRAVAQGRVELGILPIENSVIGEVREAQAALRSVEGLVIVEDATFPIRQCLLALPGATMAGLRWVESHPAALAQCADWLADRGLRMRAVDDTAGAARSIAADRDYTRAAIAGVEAAELYGLEVLAHDIADRSDNCTRFVVIATSARAEVAA